MYINEIDLNKNSHPACSSSSIPICLETVFNELTESLIASSWLSCCLIMYCCCAKVSLTNLCGLSSSFSSLEYFVDPCPFETRTGLLSKSGCKLIKKIILLLYQVYICIYIVITEFTIMTLLK